MSKVVDEVIAANKKYGSTDGSAPSLSRRLGPTNARVEQRGARPNNYGRTTLRTG